jgi:cysteate synthase
MSKEFKPTEYILQSVNTSKQFNDAGWTLDAPDEKEATLIRAIYKK